MKINFTNIMNRILALTITLLIAGASAGVYGQSGFCDATIRNVTCFGGSDGFIIMSPTSGTSPYSYMWSNDLTLTGNSAFGLTAGTYTITVTDAVNTSQVCVISITEPTAIVIDSIIEVNPICNINNGSLEIFATPKSGSVSGNLMYSIDGGISFQASRLFPNLGAADYLVIVADEDGCTAAASPQLVNTPPPNVSLVASCGTGGNIDIDATVTGGTTPYASFSWTGPGGFTANTEDINNVPTGTYTLVVTDRVGCTAGMSVTLTSCCTPDFFCESLVNHVTCNGGSDGSITIVPVGGTSPYTYMWSNDATLMTNSAFGLTAGIYMTTVTDANGCSQVCTVEITEPTAILIDSIIEVNPICNLDNGSLEIFATPKTGSGSNVLMYSIDGGLVFQPNNFFGGLGAADYLVVVSDGDNCTAVSSPQLVNTPPPTVVLNASCSSGSTIDIDATVSGGTLPYASFDWSGPGGFTATSEDIFGVPEGTYTLVVTDRIGCTASAVITLTDCCTLTDVTAVPSCTDNGLGNIDISVVGGTPGALSYSWSGPNGFTSTDEDLIGVPEGTYSVTVTETSVCFVTGTFVLENCCFLTGVDHTATCAGDGTISIDITPLGSLTGPLTYSWTGPGGFTSTNEDLVDVPQGTYNVTVTATPDCFVTASITLVDCEKLEIGGKVWVDRNGNGLQDGAEICLPDIPVTLCDQNNAFFDLVYTDANGNYLFENLNPGCYIIKFGIPEGYEHTFPNVGPNDNIDSDVTGNNGANSTDMICLTPDGGSEYNIDDGIFECIPVGELVWFDVIENNVWDAIENGINGVIVNIYRRDLTGAFTLFDTQVTGHKPGTPSDDGYYKFCVPPGEYYLEFDVPVEGLVTVRPKVGFDPFRDSDITNIFNNTTSIYRMFSGDEFCNIGAGFYPMATIGDLVWFDANQDGIQNAEEQPMSGVRVELYDVNGVKLAETFTNNNGTYNFDYLQQSDYYLKFEPMQGYMSLTIPNAGTDESLDSDVDHSHGPNTTKIYHTEPGDLMENVDAGVVFSVLPVTWLDLYGEHRQEHNFLSWDVTDEVNNAYFSVERKLEGTDAFDQIGRVEAGGNTYTANTYTFKDWDLQGPGNYYYRIKQVDYDGLYSYSDVVAVKVNGDRRRDFQMYPNPATNEVHFRLFADSPEVATIELFDVTGKRIRTVGLAQPVENVQVLNMPLNTLPRGTYTVKAAIGRSVFIKKLVKL